MAGSAFLLARRGPTTLSTQIARRGAIHNAPEHSEHTVCRRRVDIWKDVETGAYLACVEESMTQGRSKASALLAIESMIKMQASWAAAPSGEWIKRAAKEICNAGYCGPYSFVEEILTRHAAQQEQK